MNGICDELLYQDNEKALYKQGAFYILQTKYSMRHGISTIIKDLPDWYIAEMRNKKIDDILNKDI